MAEELGLRRTMDFVFGKGGGETMTAVENDQLSDKLFSALCALCTIDASWL